MARPPKWISEENAAFGILPLRQYWQEINRNDRAKTSCAREKRKAHDKKRRKCQCKAYPWPHRPRGGFCRFPDPPVQQWQRKPGGRPYRNRYAGIRQQIARADGLHPIRDRVAIEKLMPTVYIAAKQLKQQSRRVKYRNVELEGSIARGSGEISELRVRAHFQSAGPMM